MTVTLTQRARNGRLIALKAKTVEKTGTDILIMSSRKKVDLPIFMSRRAPSAQTLALAA